MKKIFFVILFVLFFVGLVSLQAEAKIVGKITLKDNKQIVKLYLKKGKFQGIIGAESISPKTGQNLNFNSDRVGWGAKSQAIGVLKKKTKSVAIFEIFSTVNSDWGNWTLRDEGKEYWMNVDQFKFLGKSWEKKDNKIQYGNYIPWSIAISSPGTAVINFGSNILSGFCSSIKPDDVEYIQWVGYNAKDLAKGYIVLDELGNYVVSISGMPNIDNGLFAAVMKIGGFVWFNINGGWVYGSNIVVDQAKGRLEYTITQ